MVPPAPAHFHKAARKAFTDEPTAFYQVDRTPVIRLDVSLDAMQFEYSEGMSQDQQHALTHQTLSRVRQECIVTGGRILKISSNHIV